MTIPYPAIRSAISPAVTDGYGPYNSAIKLIEGLFAGGQNGFWLPFTDFASLSQDSAGTLPYTALEQPVGRVLDRSGRGNHASQPTSTARGVVSARVNLLTKTNQIGDGVAAWGNVNGLSVTLGAAQGPDGSYSMSRLTVAGGIPNQRAQQTWPTAPNVVYIVSLVIKKESGSTSRLTIYNSTISTLLGTTTIVWTGSDPTFTGNVGWISNPVATNLGGGNFLVSATFSPGANTSCAFLIYKDGSIGDSVLVGDAEIKPASQAALPYQRVNTPTDYDSVGFPKYARLDGTDDFYTCGGGGSTTGFFYSDVVRPTTSTFSALLADNTASGGYLVQRTNTGIYFSANAGAAITSVSLPLAANVQAFVSAMDDGVNLTLQVNGAEASIARPVVTAGASTMYLGRYTTLAQYFNGSMTEPIYRAGPPPSAYERSVIRAYQMQKAGL